MACLNSEQDFLFYTQLFNLFDMDFDMLNRRTTPELEILKSEANEQLYLLQNSPDKDQIDYWMSLSTICKNIIKSRENG